MYFESERLWKTERLWVFQSLKDSEKLKDSERLKDSFRVWKSLKDSERLWKRGDGRERRNPRGHARHYEACRNWRVETCYSDATVCDKTVAGRCTQRQGDWVGDYPQMRFLSWLKIKPFRLVFACITDSDNQGKVPSGSIIDRDNQGSLRLIITDNQAFFTTSLPTSPILTMIHRTKQMTESKSKPLGRGPPTYALRPFFNHFFWMQQINLFRSCNHSSF